MQDLQPARLIRHAALVACILASSSYFHRSSAQAASRVGGRLWQVSIGVDFFYQGFVFNVYVPNKLVIHAGDSVQWTNLIGSRPQTVTFGPALLIPPLFTRKDGTEINPDVVKRVGGRTIGDVSQQVFSSGALLTGLPSVTNTYTFTFPNPGTYLYRSLFHPLTTGEIDVVPRNAPVSSFPPDTGPTYYAVLKSVDKTMDNARGPERAAAANANGNTTIQIGGGDANISLVRFVPQGVTVRVGHTVTWQIPEASGDPHAIVFGPTSNELSSVPLYTGVAPDGGLIVNPAYTQTTIPSGSTILTDTFRLKSRIMSGILYGSSPVYPSPVSSSYSLTFGATGTYLYADPFPPGNVGAISVVP